MTNTIYCPVCGCDIKASMEDGDSESEYDGYIFVHKDVVHSESDLEALIVGVQ